MAREDGGIMGRLTDALTDIVEARTDGTLIPDERLEILEAVETDYSALRKELDLIGYSVMDFLSGNQEDLRPESRRKFAQQARQVYLQDPQEGAAIDLLNDFVLGRGMPQPRAHDDDVQKIIEEAWDDPDNKMVLTSYSAQVALNTDLSLQANVFLLMFKGKDGRVKLGVLRHDDVENVVRDPENRLRVLWYVARQSSVKWDFKADAPDQKSVAGANGKPKVFYYEHHANVQDLRDDSIKFDEPPKEKMGEGLVYHIAINRGMEQVFGSPPLRRTVRWASALNSFLKARVDVMNATAAFIMQRKVKGTKQQVERLASQAISRESPLARQGTLGVDGEGLALGPRPGAIITENEGVEHQQLRLDSGASNAQADAAMLRGQVAAGSRMPAAWMGGDLGGLAGAASLELPSLKYVEGRQELLEEAVRWFTDSTIDHAIDCGRLEKWVDASTDEESNPSQKAIGGAGPALDEFPPQMLEARKPRATGARPSQDEEPPPGKKARDLSYDFSMPSPTRRILGDLVNAVTNIAKTFDPNGTNMELSRVLLTIALGEGLEMEAPAEAVKVIFPPGYQDPALAAMMPQQPPPIPDANQPGSPEQPAPTDPSGNPYSLPQQLGVQSGSFGGGGAWMGEAREDSPIGALEAEVRALFDQDVTAMTLAVLDAETEAAQAHGDDATPE